VKRFIRLSFGIPLVPSGCATTFAETKPSTSLMEFIARALVNDREALVKQFAFQSMMAQQG
jgi:hypothetical protein